MVCNNQNKRVRNPPIGSTTLWAEISNICQPCLATQRQAYPFTPNQTRTKFNSFASLITLPVDLVTGFKSHSKYQLLVNSQLTWTFRFALIEGAAHVLGVIELNPSKSELINFLNLIRTIVQRAVDKIPIVLIVSLM